MKPPPFLKEVERAEERSHRGREFFASFCRLAACAVSGGKREEEYLAEAKRWTRPELDEFARLLGVLVQESEATPLTDLLGPTHMARGGRWQQLGGEFYTPQSVSDLCAQMTVSKEDVARHVAERRPCHIMEPACGSGGMVLAVAKVFAEHRLWMRVTAVDVSRHAADMTFIQTTLHGIPARVIHGNSLSGETWGVYRNLWWERVGARQSEIAVADDRELLREIIRVNLPPPPPLPVGAQLTFLPQLLPNPVNPVKNLLAA